MPLQIIRQDITKIKCDAIVNPTDSVLSGSGGTDEKIHLAAGPEMDQACAKIAVCPVGEARITKGYSLPCQYVIHTSGPIWGGGESGEKELLEACYSNSLSLAKEYKCKTIVFPLIASGTFGFPKDRVLKIAMNVISDFLFENEMLVYLCVFDKQAYELSGKLFSDVTAYIDDKYADESHYEINKSPQSYRADLVGAASTLQAKEMVIKGKTCLSEETSKPKASIKSKIPIEEWLKNKDLSFAIMLVDIIEKKGMTCVQFYKKANINKKTFWKIYNKADYKPSKLTVICAAIALELSLEETQQLLKTVGFTLSHSNKFDLIIEFFISQGNYDIFEINETLFKFDQVCLGC